MTYSVFVPADPNHRCFRSGDEEMFLGRQWYYFWNPGRSLLRRHSRDPSDTHVVTVRMFAGHPPRTALELTQKFYDVRRGRARARRWRRPVSDGPLKPGGPRLVPVGDLGMMDIGLVHEAITGMPLAARDREAALTRVVRLMDEMTWALTDRIDRHWGGRQLRPRLWLVQRSWIPSDIRVLGARRPVLSPDAVISVVNPNPKRPGSASWARYELYRAGMTLEEALAAGLTMADLQFDLERSYISLLPP
jgi:hypothetical protein